MKSDSYKYIVGLAYMDEERITEYRFDDMQDAFGFIYKKYYTEGDKIKSLGYFIIDECERVVTEGVYINEK